MNKVQVHEVAVNLSTACMLMWGIAISWMIPEWFGRIFFLNLSLTYLTIKFPFICMISIDGCME